MSIGVHTDASLQLPKSQSGVFVFLFSQRGTRIPLMWRSSRQPLATISTLASETVAMHEGVQYAMAITELLRDRTMYVWTDHQFTITAGNRGWSAALAYLSRAIGLRFASIADLTELGALKIAYVESESNLADFMTKPLDKDALRRAALAIGLQFEEA